MVKSYKKKLEKLQKHHKQVKDELGRTKILRKIDTTFTKIVEKVNDRIAGENVKLKERLEAALQANRLYKVSWKKKKKKKKKMNNQKKKHF